MIGSGIGFVLGTGTLRGAGHLGGSPFAFTCQFDGWLHGAPVVTTLNGDFSGWNNGAVFVDTGIRSPAPGPTGYCTGTAVLQGLKFGTGSGSGTCTGTGSLAGAGSCNGSGSGFCTGTGVITGSFTPPSVGTWFLRRVSPVQPITPVYSPAVYPAWDRRVSAKPPRQRQVSFT